MPDSKPIHEIPAKWLQLAGMQNFKPLRSSYRCDQPHTLIPVANIEPPQRAPGVIRDANGFRRDDMMKLLADIKNDESIWPVKIEDGGPPFRVYHGFHRFYASQTLGFSHLPVVIVGAR
jgi:hypothetical protein